MHVQCSQHAGCSCFQCRPCINIRCGRGISDMTVDGFLAWILINRKDRHVDRQIGKQTDRQTGRKGGRERNRKKERMQRRGVRRGMCDLLIQFRYSLMTNNISKYEKPNNLINLQQKNESCRPRNTWLADRSIQPRAAEHRVRSAQYWQTPRANPSIGQTSSIPSNLRKLSASQGKPSQNVNVDIWIEKSPFRYHALYRSAVAGFTFNGDTRKFGSGNSLPNSHKRE